ncbi:sensor histidine kinase [Nocardiopsis sp. FIRDI 009]|uniref:sensor histidine kinase n=1 Tax=Nocardiopsis sp. FIRDI 009 TaxID=714197 RepID=UPI00272BB915|nr:histidine kinase [Nocardiopsis sp. FIRDI 009]
MDRDVTGVDGVDGRYAFRLRVARIVIMASMMFGAAMTLVWPVVALVVSTGMAGEPLWAAVLSVVTAVAATATLCVMIRDRVDTRRTADPRILWTSLALAVLTYALTATPVFALLSLATWWGMAVFAVQRRRVVWVSAVLLVLPWLRLLPPGADIHPALFAVLWLVAVGQALVATGACLASLWLWDVTNEAVAGQRARARLAVTEERLRFSRDMHDLLGHSLSALAVKSELAGRLLEPAPERAAAEMAQVHALARTSLAQVRSAVSGYREVDLAEEVESVTAVLRANRTEVAVTGLDGPSLPPRTGTLAAWVVREGATNVLRHSDATRCEISFSRTREPGAGTESLVVEVANDRARGGPGRDTAFGNGLSGLSERVVAGGGVLSASRTGDGGFLLRAVLPLDRRARAEEGAVSAGRRDR